MCFEPLVPGQPQELAGQPPRSEQGPEVRTLGPGHLLLGTAETHCRPSHRPLGPYGSKTPVEVRGLQVELGREQRTGRGERGLSSALPMAPS